MGGIRIEGGVSALSPDVKTDAAGNTLCVQLSNTPANIGSARMLSENDPGTVLGSALLRSPETSGDWRKRVAIDTILLNETLNYTAQNSGLLAHILTTMTVTNQVNGAVLNGSGITTINTGAMVKSYQRFPLLGAAPLYAEATALYSAALGANQVMEIGLFDVAAATTVTALDGVFFRYTGTQLNCIVNFNGSEVASVNVAAPPALNVMHKYTIIAGERTTEFWINDILVANVATPAANSQSFASGSAPFAARYYTGGTVNATVQSLRLGDIFISQGDYATFKPWSEQMVLMGNNAIQGIGGMTQGQTANYVNSTVPASATLSNTAAGYTTLGGQFQFAAVAGAETDYALFAFQVPAASATVTGRTLVIQSIAIDTFNTVVAVATTATLLQ